MNKEVFQASVVEEGDMDSLIHGRFSNLEHEQLPIQVDGERLLIPENDSAHLVSLRSAKLPINALCKGKDNHRPIREKDAKEVQFGVGLRKT